ncbi:MAG: hypothetical protein ACFFBP_08720 [Promethearchaeota archaeon]
MPRCHRHGYHNSGYPNRYRPNYFAGNGNNKLNIYKPKEILYISTNKRVPIEYQKPPSLNHHLNQRRMNNIDLKIKDIQSKIKDEIKSRKIIIKNHISKDDETLTWQEGNIYRLKPEYINFLSENSKFGFLKRRKLKKTLEFIRFNLNHDSEDILIDYKKNKIFSSDSLSSVLKVKSSEWKKWEDIIKLIGANINDYKLSIKEQVLDQLYHDYDDIFFPDNKEQVKICEKCGLENKRKALYCYYCGNKF